MTAPGFWQQVWWRFKPASPARYVCSGFHDLSRELDQGVCTFVENSYPQNHTFSAQGDHLTPSRKLAKRLDRLTRHYPAGWNSFVDLSCSKGYFVFHAAQQPQCRRAMGVDVDERCLFSCRQLLARFEFRERTSFVEVALNELAARIDEFGGPFDVALLINTYQYLVFGSEVGPPLSSDHREIFRMLRQVCSGRLIFHNRLSFADLQRDPQNRASDAGKCSYEPELIRQAASEFFDIVALDSWSRRPVWLLDAR